MRKAFDAYIFLSYRKKDRRYAQELMRLIHQNEFCRDIAIWYDEFLVPGEDFNHSIQAAMEKSELFTFVVTPNLLECDNYVMTVEYPAAKETGKPILPAEMVPTDRAQLQRDYKEIPEPADAHNAPLLSDALLKGLRDLAIAENDDDPAHLFFIGLAYLNGIDMEENRERGVQLIETAANADLPEAMEKLSRIYESGDGVERDYEISAQWMEKLADYWDRQFEMSESGEDGKELFIALWNAGDARIRQGKLERAGESYKKMEKVAQKIAPKFDKFMNHWFLSVCCNRIGDLCIEKGDMTKAGQYFVKAARASEPIARETGLVKDNQNFSVDCERLGDFYMAQGDLKKARIWHEKRMAVAEKMASEIGTILYRREVPTSYARMGILCRDEGNPEQAMGWFRKSMELYEQIAKETGSPEDYQDLSLSYVQVGGISEAQGKQSEAKEWYRKAIAKQEILAESLCTVEARRELCISCERLADVYCAEGNLQEARRRYEQNLTLSTALAEETGTFKARMDLSYSYDRMGKLCQTEGNMQEAQSWYEKTIQLRKQLARENGSVKSRQLLGSAYQDMGSVFLLQRDLPAAQSWYEKAREQLESLARETGTVKARTDLTACYNSLGFVLNEEGKTDEARELFEKMVTLGKQLVEETGTRQARISLARAYDRMGNLYFGSKQYDRAQQWLSEGMQVWESLAAETETTDVLDALATSCLWNAVVISEKLDLPLLKKAEAIWDRLVRQCPDVASYSNNLNNVRNVIRAEEETRGKNSLSGHFLQSMDRLPAKWNQTENKHLINLERRNSQKGTRISVDLYYEVKKHFLKKTTAEYVLDISCTYRDGYVVRKHLLRAESLDEIRAYMSREGIDGKLEEYIRRPQE